MLRTPAIIWSPIAAAATSASHVLRADVDCLDDLNKTTDPPHETITPDWLVVETPPKLASLQVIRDFGYRSFLKVILACIVPGR